MMNARRGPLLATLALPFLLSALAACDREPDNRPPEQLWKEVCATCHAPNGAGLRHKLGKAIDMRTDAWQRSVTDDEIADTIRNGKVGFKVMPGFGDQFSDEQVDGLVKYVRTEIADTPPK